MKFRGGPVKHPIALFAVLLLGSLSMPGAAPAFIDPPAPDRLDSGPVLPLAAEPRIGDGLDAGRGHEGLDLFAPAGTPLVAVDDGVVLETGSDGGRGNYVSIFDQARNRTYNYLHLRGPARVAAGDRVRAGEPVGELGCTGSCWGNHLHFELRVGRSPYGPVLDPLPLIEGLDPPPPPRLPAPLRQRPRA